MQEIFVFPTSRRYAVDPVAERIVRILYERNFAVEGVAVALESYSNKDATYTMVDTVTIPDLDIYLKYDRKQGHLDSDRFDCASIATIAVPLHTIQLYGDDSGPTYHVYVGKNWKIDKREFVHGFHVNSKLNKQPRTYLKYSGAADTEGRFLGSNRYLVADNDLGREYDPKGDEAKYYETSKVLEQLAAILGNVADFLERQPDGEPLPEGVAEIETVWQGLATEENKNALVKRLQTFLSKQPYHFDDGWSSSRRRGSQKFRGISSSKGYISISDTYGSFGIGTNDNVSVSITEDVLEIHHPETSYRDAIHWTITSVPEEED